MSLNNNWKVGEEKLIYNSLGINVFVKKVKAITRELFSTSINKFIIILKKSKGKPSLNLIDHNADFLRTCMNNMFSEVLESYRHKKGLFIQMDIHLGS